MLSVGLIKRPNSTEPNSSTGLSELRTSISTHFNTISQKANGEYVYEFYNLRLSKMLLFFSVLFPSHEGFAYCL
jgi:hypothetical protein